jgi:hypothetical protein
MTTTSPVGARRTPRTLLPAVLAIPVTIVGGLYALGGLASAALNDVAANPNTTWLAAAFYAQGVLVISAIALFIVALTRAGQHRIVPVLGWLLIALSAAMIVASASLATAS